MFYENEGKGRLEFFQKFTRFGSPTRPLLPRPPDDHPTQNICILRFIYVKKRHSRSMRSIPSHKCHFFDVMILRLQSQLCEDRWRMSIHRRRYWNTYFRAAFGPIWIFGRPGKEEPGSTTAQKTNDARRRES